MKETQDILVGLDIGTTKIACIVAQQKNNGKIELLGIGQSESIGVKRGVVVNIEQTVQSIQKAVQEAEEKAGVMIKNVCVGIAGQHIKSLQHRIMRTRDQADQEINEADLQALIDDVHKIVLSPGEEIIHVIPQEYIVESEHHVTNPIGMNGARLEADFHIITGDIKAIKNIYKCVERAGLCIEELTLEPLASAAAVLTDEEREAGVVLVDIGGGTTDIAIFQEHIIRHTAVIPFGGNAITEDIKMGCGLLEKYAEALKVKYGSAVVLAEQENQVISIPGLKGRPAREISMKNLSAIINSRMEEIIEQVAYEIESSGFSHRLAAGIVITGGGAELKNIKQLFDYVTGMITRIGYPNEYVDSKDAELADNPKLATGIGLILKNLHEDKKDTNKKSTKQSKVIQIEQVNFVHKIKGFLNSFMNEEID
jgi:cell division protein FtsA